MVKRSVHIKFRTGMYKQASFVLKINPSLEILFWIDAPISFEPAAEGSEISLENSLF